VIIRKNKKIRALDDIAIEPDTSWIFDGRAAQCIVYILVIGEVPL
jgi:hypothetical protein